MENDKKNSEYELGDFEFADENNNYEDEIEKMKKYILNSLGKKYKVDEVEVEEYSDNNFWKLPNLNNFSLDDL